MKLKRDSVKELMKKYYDGNYNRFAREIGVDPTHLHRFLKTGIGGGAKLIGSVMKFCKDRQLNFEEYVDL